MIGLGGGSLAKFCHRHLPRARIRVVEINPHVIALRDDVPRAAGRRALHRRAGRRRTVRARRRRAAATCCWWTATTARACRSRLSSQRFYDDCHRRCCSPDGVMVVNLHSGHRRFEIILDRIRRSFDDAVLVVDGRGPQQQHRLRLQATASRRACAAACCAPAELDPAAWAVLRAELAGVAAAAARRRRGRAPGRRGDMRGRVCTARERCTGHPDREDHGTARPRG
ncbi:MAG: transferase [Comamonadaceae bacterium]|nr:transferase [Comamonadaceae bacterium]